MMAQRVLHEERIQLCASVICVGVLFCTGLWALRQKVPYYEENWLEEPNINKIFHKRGSKEINIFLLSDDLPYGYVESMGNLHQAHRCHLKYEYHLYSGH